MNGHYRSCPFNYFPYGKVVREFSAGAEERFLTTQHERDAETGLDYRGARYYDADVARFLSLDPLAMNYAAWSPYNYVLGNPIMFIDPDGKSGKPVYDHENKIVTIHIKIYFYGSKATEERAASIAKSVQDEGNRPKATIDFQGSKYAVHFSVSHKVISEEQVIRIANRNGSPLVNFARLESGGSKASGTARIQGIKGSNSFWLNINDDLVEGKTAAHEILSHGFGIDHPTPQSIWQDIAKDVRPDISYPKKSETSESWGKFNGKYIELILSNRQVTQGNIEKANQNFWGEVTNLLFKKDGSYVD